VPQLSCSLVADPRFLHLFLFQKVEVSITRDGLWASTDRAVSLDWYFHFAEASQSTGVWLSVQAVQVQALGADLMAPLISSRNFY
jgi:hypothetical protein